LSFLASLPERVTPGVRIGFPEADEERTAAALNRLARDGRVRPIAVRAEAGEDDLRHAVSLLAAGELDGVVAGAVSTTAAVLRAGLQLLGPDEGIRTVSSAFYMVLPAGGNRPERVLTFTDAGVVPEPTAEQLAEIADCASRARTLIVGDEPRVAFLSYATGDSADGGSVQRMREAVRLFRLRRPGVPADGPLQADAAIVPEVARRKAPSSPIEGAANVLVFPDLDAGNIAYKLVQRLADARALGPILQGLSAPLNDLSRGASVEDILDVAYITALLANEARRQIT
jgi:phosphate acetyltransferase